MARAIQVSAGVIGGEGNGGVIDPRVGLVRDSFVGMALLQILVQLVYFLHMNSSSEGSWNLIAFIFTVLIVAILVVGSLWIMFHLNTNMGH